MPIKKTDPDSTNLTDTDGNPIEVENPEVNAKSVDTGRTAGSGTSVKPDKPTATVEEDQTPQSYVWLSNGEVLRCDDEDLPANGANGAFGHWQKDGKVYGIVGVYPVEIVLPES